MPCLNIVLKNFFSEEQTHWCGNALEQKKKKRRIWEAGRSEQDHPGLIKFLLFFSICGWYSNRKWSLISVCRNEYETQRWKYFKEKSERKGKKFLRESVWPNMHTYIYIFTHKYTYISIYLHTNKNMAGMGETPGKNLSCSVQSRAGLSCFSLLQKWIIKRQLLLPACGYTTRTFLMEIYGVNRKLWDLKQADCKTSLKEKREFVFSRILCLETPSPNLGGCFASKYFGNSIIHFIFI